MVLIPPSLKQLAPGQLEFDCTDCGARVYKAVDDGFEYPVCAVCRFIEANPAIDAETAARLRGVESQQK